MLLESREDDERYKINLPENDAGGEKYNLRLSKRRCPNGMKCIFRNDIMSHPHLLICDY